MQAMLTEELVTGYRSYAEAADLNVGAAADVPASSPFCGFVASFMFSYVTTNGPGRNKAVV
ncbi:hypothetical protein GCM10010106_42540 [Thermopolyspora flexuosa]|uniref:Uncharacterized protein n=1 Tax=Thermopolyspora flexuosa TaxID=103836 RepID=A0A543IUX3_9ACTN|nr:LxmA leader domain family RiPP [Thermopolyspora flexuosa]PZN41713.1 MAG: hypothetical protein DIU60_16475 [Actinomycetota bacterium]TQM74362.1 hypothetical protein FHX40_1032 [Thermopolyspora flexuosa]GGM90465.1 hypothetical protein GCM10010106_42540 [Thermopolyspora flexuosa]